METPYMELTETDRQILNSYVQMLDGLGSYLGEGYEIVLHSLENLDRSVIKIINGHWSGRKQGSPITDLALKMLGELERTPVPEVVPYGNKNKAGAFLRSCTIPIIGEHRRIIGLLCMNFHTEAPFATIIQGLMPPQDLDSPPSVTAETFSDSIDDLILTSLAETKEAVYANPAVTSANKNKEIIFQLYQKGIFNLKDAVIKVSNDLNISKNTVYMHLRNFKKT